MATDTPLLYALAQRIKVRVVETGRCLITAPVELAPLKGLGRDGLREFAARNGWTAVPRLGFTQVEFFTVNLPRVANGVV
jgi:hypothetical protein